MCLLLLLLCCLCRCELRVRVSPFADPALESRAGNNNEEDDEAEQNEEDKARKEEEKDRSVYSQVISGNSSTDTVTIDMEWVGVVNSLFLLALIVIKHPF